MPILSFWSSIVKKNISKIIQMLKKNGVVIKDSTLLLNQEACFKSLYVIPDQLDKPIFVKDLKVYNSKANLTSPPRCLTCGQFPNDERHKPRLQCN